MSVDQNIFSRYLPPSYGGRRWTNGFGKPFIAHSLLEIAKPVLFLSSSFKFATGLTGEITLEDVMSIHAATLPGCHYARSNAAHPFFLHSLRHAINIIL